MLTASSVPPEMPLDALRELYCHHALTIRNISEVWVNKQFTYLDRLFGFLGPPRTSTELFDQLDQEAISAFLVDYAPRHGPGSRRDMHGAARAFLRFAYEEGFMAQDLSALVPTVRNLATGRLPRALPQSCIAALETSIERCDPEGLRDASMVCLLHTYGVRGAQIRRLLLQHIDWERERIHFPACKHGRAIEQHLTAKAGNRLADYIANGRPDSPCGEVLLLHPAATPMTQPRQLSRVIRRRLKQADVSIPQGVSRGTHGFRHAFATRMVGRVPFKDLVDMLGHRNASNTLIYARVDVQTLQQAALPWPGASS